jgi:CBS domain-containing protein
MRLLLSIVERVLMFARDVMTSPVVSVTADTRVKRAAALLATGGYTALPVVDENERLVGIVSEADVVRGRFPRDPRSRITATHEPGTPTAAAMVGEVMSTDVLSVHTTTDVVDLVAVMLEHGVRSIPVVDGARAVGIVTRRDLVRAFARDDEAIAAAVRHRLTSYGGSDRWTVEVTDGEVSIRDEFDDPTDRHVAEVLAQSVPGVIAARVTSAGA